MAVEIGLGLSTQAGPRTTVRDALQAAGSAVNKPSALRFAGTFNCVPANVRAAPITIRPRFGRDSAFAGATVRGPACGKGRSDALFAIRRAATIESKRQLEIVAHGEIGCRRHRWFRSTGMAYVRFGLTEGS